MTAPPDDSATRWPGSLVRLAAAEEQFLQAVALATGGRII
jgi:hypothetical protein